MQKFDYLEPRAHNVFSFRGLKVLMTTQEAFNAEFCDTEEMFFVEETGHPIVLTHVLHFAGSGLHVECTEDLSIFRCCVERDCYGSHGWLNGAWAERNDNGKAHQLEMSLDRLVEFGEFEGCSFETFSKK